jgi:hypothetical protein
MHPNERAPNQSSCLGVRRACALCVSQQQQSNSQLKEVSSANEGSYCPLAFDLSGESDN